MKIVELRASNIKRLVAVAIRPDGNVVEITGRNGAGKSSVLDAIWWALAGAKHIQKVPIRRGATEAHIELDLGQIIVTRHFGTQDSGEITTHLTVAARDGATYRSPQTLIDSLFGALSFDPLAFTRMDPGEQFAVLRQFVPEVDFDAIEAANQRDFDERRDLNRQAKAEASTADRLAQPDEHLLPVKEIDIAELVAEMEAAGRQNTEIEARKTRRAEAQADVQQLRQDAQRLYEQAELLRKQAVEREADAKAVQQKADALQKKLDEAPALPEPVNTMALREKINEARSLNTKISVRQQRKEHLALARQHREASEALTAAMEARKREMREKIAQAKLPVPGLDLAEGIVTLNGLPFEQASDAEQLRTSVAIAMALNPKLRVIRVRDGSLLDEGGMKLLAQLAQEHDCQVWIERVTDESAVGFVIEDGQLKQPAMAAE